MLLSLYVVTDGGIVFNSSGVLTRSKRFFQPYGCAAAPEFYTTMPRQFTRALGNITDMPCFSHIFVISRRPDFNFYHFFIEHVSRLAGYVHFLRNRPDMPVHVLKESEVLARKFLPLLGLQNPVVSGHVTANTIYLPQGGGCHDPNLASVQLAAAHYRTYMQRFSADFHERMRIKHSSKPMILLLKHLEKVVKK